MDLKEYEGRALFEKYGIPVPRSFVATNADEALKLARELGVPDFVLKAQILGGKRGKSGGIVYDDLENFIEKFNELMGKEIGGLAFDEILVAEKLDIKKELYLSITIDRFERRPVVIFSEEGGMEIEEIAASHPDKIIRTVPEKLDLPAGIATFAEKLFELFVREDAILAEVNPLILDTHDNLFAADAKITIDDNALARHEEWQGFNNRKMSDLEVEAKENGLAYVGLDGDIAIIGNGAGLVMATLDTIHNFGGSPANFCDIGGGASQEMMEKALKIVLQKSDVRGIFINIFGGITHCDEIAEGLVHYLKNNKRDLPMVVRMVGTNQKEARNILEGGGIISEISFDAAAKKIVSLTS